MTPYQLLLLGVLVAWPIAVIGLLMLMGRLENYVARSDATTPQEAGLEPVAGSPPDRKVKIVFGDAVVGEPQEEEIHSRATHSTSTRAPLGKPATPTVARAGGSEAKNSP